MVKYYYQKGKPVGVLWEPSGETDTPLVIAIIASVSITGLLLYFYSKKMK